jgi:hypothetical protein
MVRFERAGWGLFWEVELQGLELVERAGRSGGPPAEHRRVLPDERAARTRLRKRVLDKQKEGFGLAIPPAKGPQASDALQVIARSRPNDTELQSVYRDQLLALGDPRGELLALMARLGDASDDAWFDCWRALERAFRSFIEGAELHGTHERAELTLDADGSFPDLTTAAFQRLERLTVKSAWSLQPAIDAIASAKPPALRHLSLESTARQLGALGPMLSRAQLDSLRLHGTDFSLGEGPVRLESLTVVPQQSLFSGAISALRKTSFPDLLTLSVVATEAEAVVGWLFTAKNMPALKTLRIQLQYSGAELSLLELLTRAPLLRQLLQIDLLGTFDYEFLRGLFRTVGRPLTAIHSIRVTADLEQAELERLRSVASGLELIPFENF